MRLHVNLQSGNQHQRPEEAKQAYITMQRRISKDVRKSAQWQEVKDPQTFIKNITIVEAFSPSENRKSTKHCSQSESSWCWNKNMEDDYGKLQQKQEWSPILANYKVVARDGRLGILQQRTKAVAKRRLTTLTTAYYVGITSLEPLNLSCKRIQQCFIAISVMYGVSKIGERSTRSLKLSLELKSPSTQGR